jgi:(1->4)-alpha-D-glucan 1-alpha-D-glucosylmutase
MATSSRRVLATYRLQLRGGLDLAAAEQLLPYLSELGVSHVYLSPILTAAEGSTHGYDVVDPTRIDPALGGPDGFRAFVDAAHDHGLGVVVDIVPNHMAADAERNAWWRDVLRHGRASTHAFTFDITWDPPDRKLHDHVLLPVLGDHYGRELEAGRFHLERAGDEELVVRVYETSYPLDPRSAALLWQQAAGRARGIEDVLDEVNRDTGRLHEVLEQQHYRLAR